LSSRSRGCALDSAIAVSGSLSCWIRCVGTVASAGAGDRLIPVSKDGAGATPEQRHGDTDDEREDDFERHVRWLL
jgi:hypothetical protein